MATNPTSSPYSYNVSSCIYTYISRLYIQTHTWPLTPPPARTRIVSRPVYTHIFLVYTYTHTHDHEHPPARTRIMSCPVMHRYIFLLFTHTTHTANPPSSPFLHNVSRPVYTHTYIPGIHIHTRTRVYTHMFTQITYKYGVGRKRGGVKGGGGGTSVLHEEWQTPLLATGVAFFFIINTLATHTHTHNTAAGVAFFSFVDF